MSIALWIHTNTEQPLPSEHERQITWVRSATVVEALAHMDRSKPVSLMFMEVSRLGQAEAAQRLKQQWMRQGRVVTLVFLVPSWETVSLSQALGWGADDALVWPNVDTPSLSHSLTRIWHQHHQLSALAQEKRSLVQQQAQMSDEFKIVERVFDNVINRPKADLNHVKTYMSPMARFNGDLSLVLESPSGDTYVLLGDFTGHGLSAAIGCLPVSDIFYAMVPKGAEVDDIAREINRKLLNILPDNMFLCAIILRVNRSHTEMQVWSGGMYDLMVLDKPRDGHSSVSLECLPSQCMPLGILLEEEFESTLTTYPLQHDMRLFLYSDGLIEAQDTSGESFGEVRLMEVLERVLPQLADTDSLIDRVLSEFLTFIGSSEPSDDVSMVECHCGKAVDVWESKRLPDGMAPTHSSGSRVLPWHFGAVLLPDHLRQQDVAMDIMALLRACQLDEDSLALVHTIFSELFNNALEHGLLKLSSEEKESAEGFESYYLKRQAGLAALSTGEIRINVHVAHSVEFSEQVDLEMTISDTGEGYSPDLNAVDDDLAHGRGLFLLKALCHRIEVSNRGRMVTVSLPVTLANMSASA